MTKIFNVYEIAAIKGVTPTAVHRAERTGILPSIKTLTGGKTKLFEEIAVKQYLSRHPGRPRKDNGNGVKHNGKRQ